MQGTLPEIKADKHIKVIMFCYLVRLVDNAGVQIDCDRRGKWIGRGGNGELQKNFMMGSCEWRWWCPYPWGLKRLFRREGTEAHQSTECGAHTERICKQGNSSI